MINRHGDAFKQMTFTENEIGYCNRKKNPAESFAARWCAKEAILKALGTGWSNGIAWKDLEIRVLVSGQPEVAIGGKILEIARSENLSQFNVTLSHCKTYATATAIIIQDSFELYDSHLIIR